MPLSGDDGIGTAQELVNNGCRRVCAGFGLEVDDERTELRVLVGGDERRAEGERVDRSGRDTTGGGRTAVTNASVAGASVPPTRGRRRRRRPASAASRRRATTRAAGPTDHDDGAGVGQRAGVERCGGADQGATAGELLAHAGEQGIVEVADDEPPTDRLAGGRRG